MSPGHIPSRLVALLATGRNPLLATQMYLAKKKQKTKKKTTKTRQFSVDSLQVDLISS